MQAPPLGPDLVEEVHEAVVDHEGDGDVQAHSAHARQRSLVEGAGTLLLHDPSEQNLYKFNILLYHLQYIS